MLKLNADFISYSHYEIARLSKKLDKAQEVEKPITENLTLNKDNDEQLIDISDLSRVKMVIGKIVEAERLPGSDKILKLKVDLGEFGLRQVLSGIAKHYSPADLVGKSVIFVINLKPRKILG